MQTHEDVPHFSHQQILRVLSGILLCIFLAAIDQTVVIPAVPATSTPPFDTASQSIVIGLVMVSAPKPPGPMGAAATPLGRIFACCPGVSGTGSLIAVGTVGPEGRPAKQIRLGPCGDSTAAVGIDGWVGTLGPGAFGPVGLYAKTYIAVRRFWTCIVLALRNYTCQFEFLGHDYFVHFGETRRRGATGWNPETGRLILLPRRQPSSV